MRWGWERVRRAGRLCAALALLLQALAALPAAAQAPPDPADTVRRYVQAVQRGDPAGATELLAEGAVLRVQGERSGHTCAAQPCVGREAIRRELERRRGLHDLTLESVQHPTATTVVARIEIRNERVSGSGAERAVHLWSFDLSDGQIVAVEERIEDTDPQTATHRQAQRAPVDAPATPPVAPPVAPPAQQPRPAGATPAQRWEVQVDNASPAGHAWSFNAFYPSRLQAHAGDTVAFRLAPNPDAFHHVTLMPAGTVPAQGYPGFMFPDPYVPGGAQTTFFSNGPNFSQRPETPCGRAGQPACTYDGAGALNSGVLVNPPAAGGGTGHRAFTVQLDAGLTPGTYFYLCLVHGPGMRGRIDVLPDAEPAQSREVLQEDARRAYESDLAGAAAAGRAIEVPGVETNPDGTRTWGLAAGGGGPDVRLSVNEFGVPALLVKAGDTVTWTMRGPAGAVHAVTGFAGPGEGAPRRLPVYEPDCQAPRPATGMGAMPGSGTGGGGGGHAGAPGEGHRASHEGQASAAPTGVVPRPAAGGFPFDLWNSCPGREVALLTVYSFPSTASGTATAGQEVTSGLLMAPEFLDGPAGQGLPFASSYSVTFPAVGTYRYACPLHSAMTGAVVVRERS
ncbi:MAG TPA: nuclear transport factor 2 family protein [Chloroflexota bacterium]|nr:nuclear transport factor 2 family protein [Chloroflexota bacterium]